MLRALAILSCAGLSSAYAEDCTLKQLASLDLIDAQGDTVMVPANIDGTKELMVVQTATIMSGIFSSTGSKLGLAPSGPMVAHAPFFDLAGHQRTTLVHIPQFGLGGMVGNNLTFLWMPPPRDLQSVAAGFLGQDILRKYDLDFDFAAKKLKLFSPEHCEGRVVYWTTAYDEISAVVRGGGHLEVTVTLDGKPLRAVIDTGVPTTMMSMSVADARFGISKDSPGVQRIPDAQRDYPVQLRYRFKTLSFGSVQAPNPLVDLFPDLARDRMALDANPVLREGIDIPPVFIGMDVLRKLHLYITYREQKIYVSAANAGGSNGGEP